MIAIFDEDGGGDVDFQEFVLGLSAFSSKGNKEEKLQFAFKVYDIDRDGYISNGELFIVLKMMVGSNLKDQQLQQIVDKTIMEADKDGDGKISFAEFQSMVENTDVSMSMTLGTFAACGVYSTALLTLLRSILGAIHLSSCMNPSYPSRCLDGLDTYRFTPAADPSVPPEPLDHEECYDEAVSTETAKCCGVKLASANHLRLCLCMFQSAVETTEYSQITTGVHCHLAVASPAHASFVLTLLVNFYRVRA